MTAAEARERATSKYKQIIEEEKRKEISDVMSEIISLAERGKFSCDIKFGLYEETIEYLQDLGYEVIQEYIDYSGSQRCTGTKIQW